MNSIKQYLKSIGVTQKDLSERIGLSRPTLDTYIELYEKGEMLPKERYNIIFDRLFSNKMMSAKQFEQILQHIEKLLIRDRNFGTTDLEPDAADYVSHVVQNMTRDMKKEDWNKDVYIFINILLSNYRENPVFLQLAEYFIFLNNVRDYNEIEEAQKPYFANMYKTFRGLIDDSHSYREEDFHAFLERCKEIKEQKKVVNDERKKKIRDKVNSMIAELDEKGIELDDDELIEEFVNRFMSEKKE